MIARLDGAALRCAVTRCAVMRCAAPDSNQAGSAASAACPCLPELSLGVARAVTSCNTLSAAPCRARLTEPDLLPLPSRVSTILSSPALPYTSRQDPPRTQGQATLEPARY